MHDSPQTLSDRFQAQVVAHLEPLTDKLIAVLGRLVGYPHVPEVDILEFEVFCDGFTQMFPVRAFFLDSQNCEYFIYRDGKAHYPCDVDPGLLELEQVYPATLEDEF